MTRRAGFTFAATLQALLSIFIFVSASIAGAQVERPGAPPGSTGGTAGAGGPNAAAPASRRFEHEGLAVEFSARPLRGGGKEAGLVAGGDAVVAFRVTDARSGEPVTGLHPLAWISSRAADRAPDDTECRSRIQSFAGGWLAARAEVDLNRYLLLALNHDNTITILDPQISFNITKMEGIVTLPGRGADWALGKSGALLYVTVPDRSAVAVVDTAARRLVGTVPTGETSRPTRLALDPDGRYVWVGLDGSAAVAVIDTGTSRLAATVPVGAGRHAVAFTSDGRFAYVTSSAAGTVSAIDAKRLARIADLDVGKTPVAVAYSRASRLVYVAAADDTAISVIDPAKQRVVRTVPTRRGVVALRFEPEGRFGFVVNQVESTVSVLDAATNAIIGSAEVVKGPDQVVFTSRYAYIRGVASERFSLIGLGEAAKGRIEPVHIQAGQSPASALPDEIGVAGMIAPTPDDNAVMVASTPDALIYYYVEGMMAPMGSFRNDRRRPHGLLLLDRSLSETAPGVYSAPARLPTGGRFDVPVLIDQPRIVHCFELEVAGPPGGNATRRAAAIAIEALFGGKRFRPGDPVALRFRITDPATSRPIAGLSDVQVLAFEPPGVWQRRQWAADLGDGVYGVTQVFPRAGLYSVMVAVASRGVSFPDLRHTVVQVLAGPEHGAGDEPGRPRRDRQ